MKGTWQSTTDTHSFEKLRASQFNRDIFRDEVARSFNQAVNAMCKEGGKSRLVIVVEPEGNAVQAKFNLEILK